ncbi:MAG: hypothetical protein EOP48_29860 [Sphingobacteriales bacterium]|nr:MAG: hypothetical protein EOP48_29860 [Sphingobacteriales bacterium]
MLGKKSWQYHLEFTKHHSNIAPRANSEENLLVFYLPDQVEWNSAFYRLQQAGFMLVEASNPYWNKNGASFEDLEGYRVVINREKWSQ